MLMDVWMCLLYRERRHALVAALTQELGDTPSIAASTCRNIPLNSAHPPSLAPIDEQDAVLSGRAPGLRNGSGMEAGGAEICALGGESGNLPGIAGRAWSDCRWTRRLR